MPSNILQKAEELLKRNESEECLRLLRSLLEQGTATVEIHKIHAEALFNLRQYDEALPSLQVCLKTWGIGCDWGLFLKARTAIQKSRRSAAEKSAFWIDSTDAVSLTFEASIQAILNGDMPAALNHFRTGCDSIFTDPEVATTWEASLATLIEAAQGRYVGKPLALTHVRKMIVSGYGWSGSGALYDYLSEFDQVVPIRFEALHLESKIGFRAIVSAAADRKEYLAAAVSFFFRTLLGHGEIRNANYFSTYEKSHKIRRRQDPLTFAKGVACLTDIIAQGFADLDQTGRVAKSTLSLLANETVNRIMVGDGIGDRIALLDNIIHVGNATLVTYLKDTNLFCTFRDPRSNFVSRKREDRGFALSAREFSDQRKKMMPQIQQELEQAEGGLAERDRVRIFRIGFEEFVLSESYRDSLATSLGLDLAVRQKHSHFKPWESMRNVTLHQEHDRPEDITLIAEVLAEYCVEPAVIPLPNALARQIAS